MWGFIFLLNMQNILLKDYNKERVNLNINDLLIYGRKYLLNDDIENKPLKIRLLLEHVLHMNK